MYSKHPFQILSVIIYPNFWFEGKILFRFQFICFEILSEKFFEEGVKAIDFQKDIKLALGCFKCRLEVTIFLCRWGGFGVQVYNEYKYKYVLIFLKKKTIKKTEIPNRNNLHSL